MAQKNPIDFGVGRIFSGDIIQMRRGKIDQECFACAQDGTLEPFQMTGLGMGG
jgi:hypothetical protein